MIDYHLDTAAKVLTLHPKAALEKSDFVALGKEVDPQIEEHGDLNGLILDVDKFPGWDGFGALVTHIRFVRDHHKHIKKIAVVTDSKLGDVAEHLTSHFISADIKHFPAGETAEAKAWIASPA